MITFQGRQNIIKTADTIERKAHCVYPHISFSNLRKRYINAYHVSDFSFKTLPAYFENIAIKLHKMRKALRSSDEYYSQLVYCMQDKKVGNCFEEAMLAQLIGKINGQKNIYVGEIYMKKENVDKDIKIDHTVAFITQKKINKDKMYSFRNKEAVIIDPWLGITDFADNYFTKLKNDFVKFFHEIPDRDFLLYMIGTDSKNIKEFRNRRRESCQAVNFSIKQASNQTLSKNSEGFFKTFFPELVIKNYEKIKLPEVTKSKQLKKKKVYNIIDTYLTLKGKIFGNKH